MMPTSLERDAQATLATLAMHITTLKAPAGPTTAAMEAHLVAMDAEQAKQQLEAEEFANDPASLQQRLAGMMAERSMLLRHIEECHTRENKLLKALGDCVGELQKQHRKRTQQFTQMLSVCDPTVLLVHGVVLVHISTPPFPKQATTMAQATINGAVSAPAPTHDAAGLGVPVPLVADAAQHAPEELEVPASALVDVQPLMGHLGVDMQHQQQQHVGMVQLQDHGSHNELHHHQHDVQQQEHAQVPVAPTSLGEQSHGKRQRLDGMYAGE